MGLAESSSRHNKQLEGRTLVICDQVTDSMAHGFAVYLGSDGKATVVDSSLGLEVPTDADTFWEMIDGTVFTAFEVVADYKGIEDADDAYKTLCGMDMPVPSLSDRDNSALRSAPFPTRLPFHDVHHLMVSLDDDGIHVLPLRDDFTALTPGAMSLHHAAHWFLNAVFPYTDPSEANRAMHAIPLPVLVYLYDHLSRHTDQEPTQAYWKAMSSLTHMGIGCDIRHHILGAGFTACRVATPFIGTCLFSALRPLGFSLNPWRHGPYSVADAVFMLRSLGFTMAEESVQALEYAASV